MATQMPKMACAMPSAKMLRNRRKTKQATRPQISVIGVRIGLGKCAVAKIVAAVMAAQVWLGKHSDQAKQEIALHQELLQKRPYSVPAEGHHPG